MNARLVTALALVATVALPSLARASDVVVQGTTDVRDAGLLDDVIIPGFHKADPQYTLKYIAVGSGQALANAEAGQGDAVLTHSPKDEAAFVKAGYADTAAGPAIFYGDYVLVGPKSDPAGVLSGAPHNAVRAFGLIAAAGKAGRANFVSRGDGSGTNKKELDIWQLAHIAPAGPWYHKANTGQGPAVQIADQCPFKGGGCYDLTDRGTFNRLIANKAVTNLEVVTDKNQAAAPGGADLLLNVFHAYVVSPKKVRGVNLAGARAFVAYLHSPGFRSQVERYPNAQHPAFVLSAAKALAGAASPPTQPAPKHSSSSSGTTWLIVGIAVIALVAVLVAVRRRRAATAAP